MKVTFEESKLLKTSIDVVSNLIDEASIIVSKEGVALKAMDPAHVAFVDLHIRTDAFSEYLVEEKMTLGLDLNQFNTILKRAGSSDKITLSASEETTLNIEIKNNFSTRRFELPLIDISEEETKLPNLDFPAEIELDPKVLVEGIKDAEIISDNIIFKADENNFYIKAEGDLGNVEVEVDKSEAIDHNVKDNCESQYQIEYLKDMAKASDISRSVKIHFGEDIPLKLEFVAPEVNLSFLVAPRVSTT